MGVGERIEKLGTKLDVLALSHFDVLHQREIPVINSWAAQGVTSERSKCKERNSHLTSGASRIVVRTRRADQVRGIEPEVPFCRNALAWGELAGKPPFFG